MKKERIKRIAKEIYPYVIVVLVVVLVRTFIITPAVVSGNSMLPNLQDNNVVLLNKLDYKLNDIKRFDIVVVNLNGEKLIKRVIALPGEHVEYKDGLLYIDGFYTSEDFEHKDTTDFKLETLGYLKIPGNKYFVVGDNRTDSIDSRMVGLISKENILGSVDLRIFPLNKIGKVK